MPVRAVTFDADDTLWDFRTVAAEASELVVEHIRSLHPHFAATANDVAELRRLVGEESPPGTPFPIIRRRTMERLVSEHLGSVPGLADEITDLFFAHRDRAVRVFDDVDKMLDTLDDDLVLGVITSGNTRWETTSIADRFSFWLAADQTGIRKPDPRVFRMAAAAAGCRLRDLVHVGDEPASDVEGARRAGVRSVWINRRGVEVPGANPDAEIRSLVDLPGLIARWNVEEVEDVGVGPHPRPWPDDPRLDPVLLAEGDRRNVVDKYRYWRREEIVADLDRLRHPFHVAIENWHHDFNIGTVVRNANAFGAAAVHIVGERRWNRRGAMVTDRYQHVHHHPTLARFLDWLTDEGLEVVGIDNLPGSQPLETATLPERCVLLFGQEGTGLSEEARSRLDRVLSIAQFGSTRSINAGVASGIAMHTWIRQHAR